jgi:hypothetical protein
MDVNVSDIRLEIYQEYLFKFTRTRFEPERLVDFLNQACAGIVQSGKKWRAEDEDDKRPERATIEDVILDPDTGLHVDKVIIDADSVLMSASQRGRTLTEADEQPKDWPEIQRIRVLLAEFFSLGIDLLNDSKQLGRTVYLTRTLGVELPVRFDRLLRPEIKAFLEQHLPAAYAERGMDVELHPYAIGVKVNTTPSAEAMKSLSHGQLKSLFARDDWAIGVQAYSDYEAMRFSYQTEMPFHQHARTLRAFSDLVSALSA